LSYEKALNFLLGVVVGISVEYVSDYLYLKMRKEGLTPSLPFIQTDENGDARQTDIYLVPFLGFEESSSHKLAKALEKDTGLRVTSTGSVTLPVEVLNRERNQYNADYLNQVVGESIAKLRDGSWKQLFIGIMKQDMYSENLGWNFALSMHYDNQISIVASERLVPNKIWDRSDAEKLFGERIYKLLKRTIGLQYYGYPRTSDQKSILFSPMMSVDDLDGMESQY
jgi:predicted Zn-dependent protease